MVRIKVEYVGMRHIRKTGSSLGINIPSEVIENLKLEESEIVRVIVGKIKNV